MRTQYPSKCFRCKKNVPAGKGDIQSIGSLSKNMRSQFATGFHGKWLVRCFACKGQGNKILTNTLP